MKSSLIILTLVIFTFTKCFSQPSTSNTNSSSQPSYLKESPLDLGRVEINMNVEKFYSKTDREFTGKTRVNLDTIYNGKGDTKELIGIQYDMEAYSITDQLASYVGVSFSPLNMIADSNGMFMALCAVNHNKDVKNYIKIVETLTEEYFPPKISTKSRPYFISNTREKAEIAEWQLDDRLIKIVHNSLTKDEGKEQEDGLLTFFIVSNASSDRLKDKLNSGDWMNVKHR